ncbi:Hypothetical predicted protein [Paramuricea clavata]|uniref:Uncharacterized protein n=1 Tax=Paramuricea clavata TaxID=317549 RepID=A0A6S7J7S3_PARCT|nr:Hypothetical predicted protein [Paramuricea clavata]
MFADNTSLTAVAKTQRKRGLNTSKSKPGDSLQINVPSDIGVVIAEGAKKVGQQLRISSQSAKCQITSEQQNIPAAGIITEQLTGIQGAMDVMENPEVNDEEESLSLLMNVIESEGLSSVLSDMDWNLMR